MINLNIKYNEHMIISIKNILHIYYFLVKVNHLKFLCQIYLFHVDQTEL